MLGSSLPKSAVVLAPHADDEAMGCSGLMAKLAQGRANSAIAAALTVTERAVEKHIANIFTKLDLLPSSQDHRRVLAVLRYLEG